MRWLIATLLIVVLTAGAYWLSREPSALQASVTLGAAFAGDTTGYARARGPRPFAFPADHGPHPAYKLEWWYYTGNLEAEGGRRFGYQFTVFRTALAPPDPGAAPRASAWAADQLYMAHLALSDIDGGAFYAYERFSRGAAGLAGARAEPFRVWLEDWSVEQQGAMPSMRVQASAGGVGLDLVMDPAKPLVLQGDRGFSPKGDAPGQASYYYSITRLRTAGHVTVGGEHYRVDGLSWMDREWSTSILGEEQEGWDWFSLQLDDGRDLMFFRLRNRDPSVPPHSDGLAVAADGKARRLGARDVGLTVLDTWQSPDTGVRYPARWRMEVPSEGLELTVTPYLLDQELDLSVRYWEGAVRLEGPGGVSGRGYLEMTGYDGGS